MNNLLLKDLKCEACNGKTPKLAPEKIIENLNKLNNWNLNKEGEMIFKKFEFKNFKQALKFVNIVSDVANKEAHHPDISFGYSYCLIMIYTNAIKGLSINDFILAAKIDLL